MGGPKLYHKDMLINYLGIYGSNVNEDVPLQINGFAIKKVDWNFKIVGPDGKIVDTFDVKHQAEIHMNWKPKKDLPDGTYSIYTEASDADGFKVEAEPTKFTVKQKK
ncbi:hypothetical protein [Heyndrickxia sporothermodurans]|uniref:hypothetical protein n=1 Tax=Heyndrickxia sporothermodurans TaxID=46224 RepID=UPI001FD5902B|nr:hypothetical protein [Heyndrickxia sporothermodurans]